MDDSCSVATGSPADSKPVMFASFNSEGFQPLSRHSPDGSPKPRVMGMDGIEWNGVEWNGIHTGLEQAIQVRELSDLLHSRAQTAVLTGGGGGGLEK